MFKNAFICGLIVNPSSFSIFSKDTFSSWSLGLHTAYPCSSVSSKSNSFETLPYVYGTLGSFPISSKLFLSISSKKVSNASFIPIIPFLLFINYKISLFYSFNSKLYLYISLLSIHLKFINIKIAGSIILFVTVWSPYINTVGLDFFTNP